MNYTSQKIQDILTSPSAVEGLDYIIPIYGEAETALWLFQAMGLEMDSCKQWVQELADQTIPQRATWSLPYWEDMLGLPQNSGLTEAERRDNVLLYRSMRAPLNPEKLSFLLEKASGVPVTIEERTAKNTFQAVFYGVPEIRRMGQAKNKLYEVRPAHLIYTLMAKEEIPFLNGEDWLLRLHGLLVQAAISNYPSYIRLDGQRRLNGEWVLDAVLAGSAFHRLTLQMAMRNKVLQAAGLAFQGRIGYSGYFTASQCAYNASIRLNSIIQGMSCPFIGFLGAVRTMADSGLCLTIPLPKGTPYAGNAALEGLLVTAAARTKERANPAKARLGLAIGREGKESRLTGRLVQDGMWRLNGGQVLNGSRKLNAFYKTEAL